MRTPIGRFMGALASLPAESLATHIVRAVVKRSRIDPERIDDVIFAQSYSNSEAPCIGRWAALAADLPIEVAGCQVDRRCGGGLQAIVNAAMMVQTGAADVVLAGGVESMSNIEHYTQGIRRGVRMGGLRLHDRLERGRERSQPVERFGFISGMIETAETLARDFEITRERADALAAESHRRAVTTRDQGYFEAEIVPISATDAKGAPVTISSDEGLRPGTSVEALAGLKPIISGGTVTAGNSSQQNDAAAACLVVAEEKLGELGLEPMAFLVDWAVAGCDPRCMGIGPVPAVAKLFARTRLGWDDVDLVEINEAFAAQVLAVFKAWGFDDCSRINVNGSGISLGHPIGCTGVRILTTLLHDMRRRGARRGLETLCIGGGQGIAALFERP